MIHEGTTSIDVGANGFVSTSGDAYVRVAGMASKGLLPRRGIQSTLGLFRCWNMVYAGVASHQVDGTYLCEQPSRVHLDFVCSANLTFLLHYDTQRKDGLGNITVQAMSYPCFLGSISAENSLTFFQNSSILASLDLVYSVFPPAGITKIKQHSFPCNIVWNGSCEKNPTKPP